MSKVEPTGNPPPRTASILGIPEEQREAAAPEAEEIIPGREFDVLLAEGAKLSSDFTKDASLGFFFKKADMTKLAGVIVKESL